MFQEDSAVLWHDIRQVSVYVRPFPPGTSPVKLFYSSFPLSPFQQHHWFTDGSRANSGTGSGIFGLRPNRSFSFPLGKFATVFQTEIYAILQCASENIRRAYKNKQILIFSDSQAALMALSSLKVT